jgi:tetratricopeptide (TPR) repeat protein
MRSGKARFRIVGRDEEQAPEDEYGEVWERLEGRTPEIISKAGERQKRAEELLRELLDLSPEGRLRRLEHAQFKSFDLLDLLLERSEEAAGASTIEAVSLSDLARQLAALLGDYCASARARTLRGNALRLRRDFEGAERTFREVPFFLEDESPERAFFSRSLALFRWEEHRVDETLALLNHAAFLFHRDGFVAEERRTLLLLGLVQFETETPQLALHPLSRAFPHTDSRDYSLLSRAGFALVSSAAESGETFIASNMLASVLSLQADLPTIPNETARYQRYLGRALLSLQNYANARECLELARNLFLKEERISELGLTSLDLGVLLAETGRLEEIVTLVRDIQALDPSSNGTGAVAVRALQRFADDLGFGGSVGRSRDHAAAELRRRLRTRGVEVEPIPSL